MERVVVVLVADLELGRTLESADQHVRAGSLHADDEDRDREGSHVVGATPSGFAHGERDAFERVQLILFDQPADPLVTRPMDVAGDASQQTAWRRLILERCRHGDGPSGGPVGLDQAVAQRVRDGFELRVDA